MDSLGLVALVFMLIPGFIADQAYRACWGLETGDHYEGTLRALVWSVLGLGLYALVFGGMPNYLPVLTDNTALAPGRWTFFALVGHTALATVAATAVGWTVSQKPVHDWFVRTFGRSMRDESLWDMIMRHDIKGRGVLVELVDGRALTGTHYATSTSSDKKEMAIADPFERQPDGSWRLLDDTRLLFVAEKNIRLMKLSLTDAERKANEDAKQSAAGSGHHEDSANADRRADGRDAVGHGPEPQAAIRATAAPGSATDRCLPDSTNVGKPE